MYQHLLVLLLLPKIRRYQSVDKHLNDGKHIKYNNVSPKANRKLTTKDPRFITRGENGNCVAHLIVELSITYND